MLGSRFYAAAVSAAPMPVGVGGHTFVLPHVPADGWLLALSDEDVVGAILPGMLQEAAEDRLYRLVESGRVTLPDVQKGALQAITDASGRKWWETMKLVSMAGSENGEFFGRMLVKGIDPSSITLGSWCAAAYSLALSNMDDKERLKFTSRLMAPPAGVDFETEADEGMSFDSMVKMARSMPGMRVGG